MDTALALREHGMGFVVAPLPTVGGETVHRIDERYTASVFPFLEGVHGRFGEEMTDDQLARLIAVLARLHDAPPAARALAPRRGLALPGRAALQAALRDLRRPWTGGPFSEPARDWLAEHERAVRAAVASFDRLASRVAASGATPALTHGEPHPGNVVRCGERLLLVDWDTVAIAPPERDMWSLVRRAPDAAEIYAGATGRSLDPDALELYRLAWDLGDLASYLNVFRARHGRSADTEKAWAGVAHAPFPGQGVQPAALASAAPLPTQS